MMTTTNSDQGSGTIHPFERAGLGRAPFRYAGMVEQDLCYGEAILNREEYERTGIALTTKPGGTCDYCGTYIVRMYRVESSDGRRFKVGCECVRKTGDANLVRRVENEERKHARVLRQRRNARRGAENAERFADDLALLERIETTALGGTFAQQFATSVACQIRGGRKAGGMTPRQRALAEKLAAELGLR